MSNLKTNDSEKKTLVADVLMQLALSIREGKTELLEFNHEREAEMTTDLDDPGRTKAVLTGVESVKVDFHRRTAP